MTAGLRRSVSSLEVPNYRKWFLGQVISLSGTWMQNVAEAWLVLKLTGSGVALGFSAALQFLPILLLGSWGGVIADRFDKRTLLRVTQVLMAVPAITLWVLATTDVVQLWMVFALILCRGTVLAIDNPTRQSFVIELVGRDRVVNAVAMNQMLVQTARVAGPALAALVIATLGVAPCFLLNALTFAGMWIVLMRLDTSDLHPAKPTPRKPGQVREGLQIVWRDPALRTPLMLTAAVGLLAFNFQVVLPVLASRTFGGGAGTYALLTGTMGVGALLGAFVAGARTEVGPQRVGLAAIGFGLALVLATVAPTLPLELAALLIVGVSSVTFTSLSNASLQLAADPALRGRVMALYAVAFLGSTPIGAPIVGAISSALGPRAGLAVGAVGALLAGAVALRQASRYRSLERNVALMSSAP